MEERNLWMLIAKAEDRNYKLWKYMKQANLIFDTQVSKEFSELGHKEVCVPFSQTEDCVKTTFEGNYNVNKDDKKEILLK